MFDTEYFCELGDPS